MGKETNPATTEDFADLHGGTFDIDTSPGDGTTVTVRFPAERIINRDPL
jgi:signal transduction histidine kinase